MENSIIESVNSRYDEKLREQIRIEQNPIIANVNRRYDRAHQVILPPLPQTPKAEDQVVKEIFSLWAVIILLLVIFGIFHSITI